MSKEFKGIYAALVTPYKTDGSINYDELQKLIDHLIKKGIDGFYSCGSTAEVFLQSTEERKKILESVVEATNKRVKVICHVGAISTDLAVELAQHAESAGADAISAISPFYYKFSNEEVISYYYDIMDASMLPMFVYNFPNFSGFSLTEDVLDKLKDKKTLAGVKFTSSDMFLLERIKTNNPDLTVWNGFDEMLAAGLIMGADGGIGSTYNCIPLLIHRIYDSFISGNISAAQEYQRQANHVIKTISKYGVFESVKTLLSFDGFDFRDCRKPFAKMTQEGRCELEAVYQRYIAE